MVGEYECSAEHIASGSDQSSAHNINIYQMVTRGSGVQLNCGSANH